MIKSNIFNPDFLDFIRALNDCKVAYLLVGGYSVILHGYSRTTGDMDIWINPTPENYSLLEIAFKEFGMPLFDMTLEKFINTAEYDVFIFGLPPVSIEIMTKVKGLSFDESFERSIQFQIGPNETVRTLALDDLIRAKQSAGRPKDLDDLGHL